MPYRLELFVIDGDEWNRSETRRAYAESSCPRGRFVVFGECSPHYGIDQGVVVVAHFDEGTSLDVAAADVVTHMVALMDEKLGAAFWEPDGEPDVYVSATETA